MLERGAERAVRGKVVEEWSAEVPLFQRPSPIGDGRMGAVAAGFSNMSVVEGAEMSTHMMRYSWLHTELREDRWP